MVSSFLRFQFLRSWLPYPRYQVHTRNAFVIQVFLTLIVFEFESAFFSIWGVRRLNVLIGRVKFFGVRDILVYSFLNDTLNWWLLCRNTLFVRIARVVSHVVAWWLACYRFWGFHLFGCYYARRLMPFARLSNLFLRRLSPCDTISFTLRLPARHYFSLLLCFRRPCHHSLCERLLFPHRACNIWQLYIEYRVISGVTLIVINPITRRWQSPGVDSAINCLIEHQNILI